MVANLEDFVEIIVKPEISDVASMLIKELDERVKNSQFFLTLTMT